MAEPPSSRIPVLQRADGSWTTVEHKLRQLDDMAEPGAYVRLLAACCRDSVQAARAMQAQLDAARAEVNALRLQLRKSADRIAQMEADRQNLCSAAQRGEAEARKAADAVRHVTEEQSRLRAQLERLSVELADSLRQRHEQHESRVRESLDSLAKKQETMLEARLEAALGDRLADLQKAQEAADGRQRLLDEAEPWSPMQHLQELPLLRSSRDAPFRWVLSGYQRLKGESQRHGQPRLYSRPFGIEREGSVRCVLRLVACLGVPAGQEPGDAVQLGLELLHSAKCAKKFDFCLRLLDRSGSDRHLVKTFSSSELAVPRYWFSRPALGVVSFAVLISEERMLREGLLSRDALAIEVGLQ
ncbi:golgin subfamily A member 6-like protein 4 isoform X1 [Dermacentor albipictus]|uniref:golgin subfamily A member 6-like protein 4 isoform X1 n=1 Tax=Dermacentor albipictus TaxID=60249 RepID=UPI0031FCB1A0